MSHKILAINPGSTSTKIALYDGEQPLWEETLRHGADEIARFARVIDQLDWRRSLILEAMRARQCDTASLAAVIGRGGLLKPIPGGVYEVNAAMQRDLREAEQEHASNLGGLLAAEIAAEAGVHAYIADPVVVDEMDDIARLSGLPECPRHSIFHALNQKAIARLYCRQQGLRYEETNLIVAHLGGGISVSAHRQGRVADTNNALDGDGPFAPERAGGLPASALVDLCFSGRHTRAGIRKMLAGRGGLVAHLGCNAVYEVAERAKTDPKSALVLEAMNYNVAKQIGAMAAALAGKVQAILLTGGIAHNACVVDYLRARCSFIAPVEVYPGENELEALAMNAYMVLQGTVEPQTYA